MEGAIVVAMFLLKGGEQMMLPARPLVVRHQAGMDGAHYRLVASVPSGEPIVVQRQGMLVLPRIHQPTTVRLLPAPGTSQFPPQSVLTVLIGPDGGNPDADYAQLSLDVSGLPQEDLVRLEPHGTSITVQSLSTPHTPKLPPQAELARDVARELLGVSFVADRAVDVVVGVDCSPSMRRLLDDGAIEAALNMFAGLASVIDPNHEVEAVLCGRVATRLPAEPIDTFAAITVTELARQPLATGCRSRGLSTAGSRSLTYLISDGVPADWRQRNDPPPHLALLASGRFAPIYDRSPESRITVLPTERVRADSSLAWDRSEMRSIVTSLLHSYDRLRKEGS